MTPETQQRPQSTITANGASTDAEVVSKLRWTENMLSYALKGLETRYQTITKETIKHIKGAGHFGGTVRGDYTLRDIFTDARSEFIKAKDLWFTPTQRTEGDIATKATLARLGKAVQTLETAAKAFEFSYNPSQRMSAVAAIGRARETESGSLEIFSKQEQEWWSLKDQMIEHTPTVKGASTDGKIESELQQIEKEISHMLPGLKIRQRTITEKTLKHIKAAGCSIRGEDAADEHDDDDLSMIFKQAQSEVNAAADLWSTNHEGADMVSKAEMLARLGKAVATMETAAKTLQYSYYASQPSYTDAYNKSLDILKARECRESWLESFSKQEQKWWDLSMRAHGKQCDDAEVPAPLEEDEMKADTRVSGENDGQHFVHGCNY